MSTNQLYDTWYDTWNEEMSELRPDEHTSHLRSFVWLVHFGINKVPVIHSRACLYKST